MQYQPPKIVDLGPIAGHTFMAVPPGCTSNCVSHKGFYNANTPDGSDNELSSSDGGPG